MYTEYKEEAEKLHTKHPNFPVEKIMKKLSKNKGDVQLVEQKI